MTNPYSATTVDLSEPIGAGETYEPQIFAVSGRIGRLRYLAYSYGSMMLVAIAMAVLAGVGAMVAGWLSMLLIIPGYIAIFALSIIMTIRRLNDRDHSGWLSLLALVPLVNVALGLYLIFAPGTKGVNSYGPPTVKNSVGVVILGLLLPIVFVIGIMAAIAIPAYQDYVKRAQAAQISQPQPAEQTRNAD